MRDCALREDNEEDHTRGLGHLLGIEQQVAVGAEGARLAVGAAAPHGDVVVQAEREVVLDQVLAGHSQVHGVPESRNQGHERTAVQIDCSHSILSTIFKLQSSKSIGQTRSIACVHPPCSHDTLSQQGQARPTTLAPAQRYKQSLQFCRNSETVKHAGCGAPELELAPHGLQQLCWNAAAGRLGAVQVDVVPHLPKECTVLQCCMWSTALHECVMLFCMFMREQRVYASADLQRFAVIPA